MSEAENEVMVDELSLLKDRARVMGITFSNNISLETLKKKIEDKMNGEEDNANGNQVNPLEIDPVKAKMTLREEINAEAMKLIRVRIKNMDPKKASLQGEIFSVANEYIGNVRKYIPYGEQSEDGYHIPNCIYQMLKAKEFLHVKVVKDRMTKVERIVTSWQKEFAIEVLPQLTEEDLERLRIAQLQANVD